MENEEVRVCGLQRVVSAPNNITHCYMMMTMLPIMRSGCDTPISHMLNI